MSNPGIDRRKYPRLFLSPSDQEYRALLDAEIEWPKGMKSHLFDLSYSGLAVSRRDLNFALTEGTTFEVRLRLQNQSPIALKTEVVRLTESMVGLRIVEVAAGGRLQIDRYIKDQLVGLNTRKLSPSLLSTEYRSDIWFHGPFDTNIFIWNGVHQSLRWVIEYDGTMVTFEGGELHAAPSYSESLRERSYMEVIPVVSRVGVESQWAERVLRLLTQIHDPQGELKTIFQILRDRV